MKKGLTDEEKEAKKQAIAATVAKKEALLSCLRKYLAEAGRCEVRELEQHEIAEALRTVEQHEDYARRNPTLVDYVPANLYSEPCNRGITRAQKVSPSLLRCKRCFAANLFSKCWIATPTMRKIDKHFSTNHQDEPPNAKLNDDDRARGAGLLEGTPIKAPKGRPRGRKRMHQRCRASKMPWHSVCCSPELTISRPRPS